MKNIHEKASSTFQRLLLQDLLLLLLRRESLYGPQKNKLLVS
jgi:hypothetical protein